MKVENRVEYNTVYSNLVYPDWTNRDKFVVEYDGGKVSATISGKMRTKSIRVLLGDNVVVKVSPYDTSRGFIVFRK